MRTSLFGHRSIRALYMAAAVATAVAGVGAANALTPRTDGALTSADGVTFGGDEIKINGTGCPGSSAKFTLSPDGATLSVSYSDFVVTSGKGSTIRDRMKSCVMDIPVNIPKGISLSLLSVAYRGTSDGLGVKGARAQQSARYWLAGPGTPLANIEGAREIVPMPDAVAGEWQIVDEFGAVGLNPTCQPVQSTLRIQSTLQLNLKGEALVSNDTTDLQSKALLRFAVRRCQL